MAQPARQHLDLPGDELWGAAVGSADPDGLWPARLPGHRVGADEGVATPPRWRCSAVALPEASRCALPGSPVETLKAGLVAAPEPVDGLVRVADDHEALRAPAQQAQEPVLHGVDVLELVHHDVLPDASY